MIGAFANQNSEREVLLVPGYAAACHGYSLEFEPSICILIVVDDAGWRCSKFASDLWLCAISASQRPTRPGRIPSRWNAVFQPQSKVI